MPLIVIAGVAVAVAVFTALKWLISQALHYWYITILGLAAVAVIAAVLAVGFVAERRERFERRAQLRYTPEHLDSLTPHEFEIACRDLLRRDGLSADRCGGPSDRAVDVRATDRSGRVIVVQCKHTTTGKRVVGSPVLYAVNGTVHDIHNASIAVVVTNGGFTKDARVVAGKLPRVYLIDRAALADWATHGRTLIDVLGIERSSTPRPEIRN